MINVQVTGFYTDVIADGFRKQAWQEPQLVALQSQLADMNLTPFVVDGFRMEQSAISGYRLSDVMLYDKTNFWQKLESKAFWLFDVAPRGWTYQNMAVAAHLYQKLCNSVDLSNDIMSPKEIDTAIRETEHTRNNSSPFVLLGRMIIPNFSRATQVTSQQTCKWKLSRNARRARAAIHRKDSARHHRRPAVALSPHKRWKVFALLCRLERNG